MHTKYFYLHIHLKNYNFTDTKGLIFKPLEKLNLFYPIIY